MAYLTGSASSAQNLIDSIASFATTLGWSVTVSAPNTTIAKATVSVKLSTDNASRVNMVWSGAPVLANNRRIFCTTFPWTYHLFGYTSPNQDAIFCIVNWNVVEFRYLAFGNLKKNGVWTGGEFLGASNGAADNPPSVYLQANTIGGASGFAAGDYSGGLFLKIHSAVLPIISSSLHVEIDANVWLSDNTAAMNVSNAAAFLIDRQPNAWNSQAVLLPYWVTLLRPSNKISVIGEVENVRMLRIDNINAGDLITLGSDQWLIFPYVKKNTTLRDGGNFTAHSGTFGWAFKKTV